MFFGPMFVYDLGFGLQSQGFQHYRDGKYEDALKLFYKSRKYLQLSGFDQLGKAEIAACYYHLGDNNAALREGGIELTPSRAAADVNNALGVILFA
ncbi:MAG: hypothetical protein AAGU05_07580, partial [Anaerolineaceae bacterium]